MKEELIFAIQELDEKISNLSLSTKEILNFEEAVTYLSVSRSYLYKLTSGAEIPHYKPSGKLIYFKKSELDNWIFKSKVKSKEETLENYLDELETSEVLIDDCVGYLSIENHVLYYCDSQYNYQAYDLKTKTTTQILENVYYPIIKIMLFIIN